MICVNHGMGFPGQVADRMFFMANGQIVEQAEPEIFSRNPTHQWTRAKTWPNIERIDP
jgi:polar amino acid transport system ATP-binding protein